MVFDRGIPTVQTAPLVRDYGTLSADTTLPLSTADAHLITLGANITLTLDTSSVPDGTTVLVPLTQDATGSWVVTIVGVTWLSGIPPTLQTAAAAIDLLEFTYSSSAATWFGRQLGKNLNANTTGNAATATKVGHSLTAGTHLSGGPFDGSAAVTLTTDATSSDTASTIAARDANGISGFKGLQFPATQSPSADANCLDDYKEDSYTATLTCGTSGTITLSGSENTLRYTKTGRTVTITGALLVSSVSSPVGTVTLNLPFAVGSTNASTSAGSVIAFNLDATFTGVPILGAFSPGNATALLGEYVAPTTSFTVANKIKVTTELVLSLSYFV